MKTQTFNLKQAPCILGWGCAVGKKESEGPLGDTFGQVFIDSRAGQKTWEEGESIFQQTAMELAMEKARIKPDQIQAIFGGDLLNQCVTTSGSLKDIHIPFFGLYGACSTMAEGLGLAAILMRRRLYGAQRRHYLLPLLHLRTSVPNSLGVWRSAHPYCAMDSYRLRRDCPGPVRLQHQGHTYDCWTDHRPEYLRRQQYGRCHGSGCYFHLDQAF